MAYVVADDVFPSTSGVGLNIAAFFKTRYPQKKIANLVEFGQPTLEALPKSDELTGLATIVPMQLSGPQGLSSTITGALGAVSSSFGAAWAITTADYYGGLVIDAKSMMAAKNDQGAFFKLKEREMDGMLTSLGNSFEAALWGNGSGSIGQVASDPGTATTFTLLNTADAFNFYKNMVINFYDNSSGALGTVADGGTRVVTGVNYGTGVITVDAAIDADVSSDAHIVRAGTNDLLIKGIPAWIPATDPTDTFFGVARTLHPQMLGGWRQSYLGSIEETVKTLDANIRRVNQAPKTLWLSYSNFNRLEMELGARGYRMEDGSGKKFGAPSLMMTGPGGPVVVKAGPYVPGNAAFLLDMSTWRIGTLGALPHLVQDDGLTARVVGVAASSGTSLAMDAVEIRYRAFWQLICDNPFANGRAEIL